MIRRAALVVITSLAVVADAQPNLSRTRLATDPATIVAKLQSSSAAERKAGFRLLGFDPDDADLKFAPLTRLYYDNLDEDDELEAVLGLEKAGVAIVVVLDKSQDSWWKVAQFTNGWRNTGDVDRTVQLRSLVDSGRAELIIRDSGGGTDISSTDISIYRFRNGSLRRVFHTTEEAQYRVIGARATGTTYEHAWLYYPDREKAGAPLIIVDRAKAILPRAPILVPDRQLRMASVQCEAYRWDSARAEFVTDPGTARTFCSAQGTAARTGRPSQGHLPPQ